MPRLAAPDVRLRLPVAGVAHLFTTHVLIEGMAGLGIGSGVPKLQPVLVQSGAAVLTPGLVALAFTVQAAPVQLSAKRLTDPDGSGPSAIWEPPPPMLRPP